MWVGSPHCPLAFDAMTSLMLLDDACAELIAGGQTTVKVDVKPKQVMNNTQSYTSTITSSGAGSNTATATQNNFLLNNIGYAKFA